LVGNLVILTPMVIWQKLKVGSEYQIKSTCWSKLEDHANGVGKIIIVFWLLEDIYFNAHQKNDKCKNSDFDICSAYIFPISCIIHILANRFVKIENMFGERRPNIRIIKSMPPLWYQHELRPRNSISYCFSMLRLCNRV